MADLSDKTILMLAADGFENSELFEPKKQLEAQGATRASRLHEDRPDPGARRMARRRDTITPDMTLSEVNEEE